MRRNTYKTGMFTAVVLLALAVSVALYKKKFVDTHAQQPLHSIENVRAEMQRILHTAGIEPVQLTAAVNNVYKQYTAVAKRDIPRFKKITNPDILTIVRQSARDFNVDYSKLAILEWSASPSPAASTQPCIYINTKTFLEYSKEAQYFMIGHELQHIIYQDSVKDYALTDLLQGLSAADKDRFLIDYSQLVEKHADLCTAHHSAAWAHRYLVFGQDNVARSINSGKKAKNSHPEHTDRLVLAQNIVNQHAQQMKVS
jgi:hypothetical protein